MPIPWLPAHNIGICRGQTGREVACFRPAFQFPSVGRTSRRLLFLRWSPPPPRPTLLALAASSSLLFPISPGCASAMTCSGGNLLCSSLFAALLLFSVSRLCDSSRAGLLAPSLVFRLVFCNFVSILLFVLHVTIGRDVDPSRHPGQPTRPDPTRNGTVADCGLACWRFRLIGVSRGALNLVIRDEDLEGEHGWEWWCRTDRSMEVLPPNPSSTPVIMVCLVSFF